MKILCYGDSNTWGYVPNIDGYSKNAVMQQYDEKDCWWSDLKKDNDIIINGLCGRCIAHENRWLKDRNASITIKDDIKTYGNLDLIFVQLGTNDCKGEYGDSPSEITDNLQTLLKTIRSMTSATIVVISPAIIKENNKITKRYYIGGEEKSEQLDTLYKAMARSEGYIFISGKDLEIGEDGEHLTIKGHNQLKNLVNNLMLTLQSEQELI